MTWRAWMGRRQSSIGLWLELIFMSAFHTAFSVPFVPLERCLHRYPTITYSDATIERFENVKNGTSFTAYGTRGERFTARKVVLATGVMDELPKKKGIEEVWGASSPIFVLRCKKPETAHRYRCLLVPLVRSLIQVQL